MEVRIELVAAVVTPLAAAVGILWKAHAAALRAQIDYLKCSGARKDERIERLENESHAYAEEVGMLRRKLNGGHE